MRAASPQTGRQPPPIPRRPRSRFIGLLVFLGLLGAGLMFVDQQQYSAPAPVNLPAVPVNPLVINSYPQQMQRPVPVYPMPVYPMPPRVVMPYSGWPVVVPNYQGHDAQRSDDRGHEHGH